MSQDEVLVRVEGRVGRLTLNRPKALHALTLGMCEAMIAALLPWRDDPAIRMVLLDHTGERGFCAGGDIRRMIQTGDPAEIAAFFGTEYRLNHLMFVYPRPIVALMDGVTMGGGVGISQPARYRVATENTLFAMPETGIGLFPDVGGGWYLPRLPGRVGAWLGLTGARLRAADCLALGLATGFVPAGRIPELTDALIARPDEPQAVIAGFAADPGPTPLGAIRADIDRLFHGRTVEAVVAALQADGGAFAKAQLDALNSKSPFSLKVTLRQLLEGAQAPDFAPEMAREYRMVQRMAISHDFREGVRALLVDRDNKPLWSPARLQDVTEAMVDQVFAPLGSGQEWTPLEMEERR